MHPHLADDTANLSPAKQPNHASNVSSAFISSEGASAQANYAFSMPTEQIQPVLGNAQSQTSESLSSDSDSSSDESDSESDSELSDIEDTATLSSNQNTAAQSSNSYCRQVTQPFDLGILGGTCKEEPEEPLQPILQQQSKPTSHRKKLAAALAGSSGLLSHSSRSSEEASLGQKRWNKDNSETAAKIPKIETPEERIQLCDLSDNAALNSFDLDETLKAERETGESLVIRIPLSKVQLEAHQKIKPQVCFN